MRFTFGMLLLLCGAEAARADVGLVHFGKDTQEQRTGDRFRISVSAGDATCRTLNVFVRARNHERPLRADLTVGDPRSPDAMIPVKMAKSQRGNGFFVSLKLTPGLARKSKLAILVDFTKEDGIQIGTEYHIDLGSYFGGP